MESNKISINENGESLSKLNCSYNSFHALSFFICIEKLAEGLVLQNIINNSVVNIE